MRGNQRIGVYFVGFLLGMLLVSGIMTRRAAREQARADPWVGHNAAMIDAGAAPLPENVAGPMAQGRMIDYGTLPEAGAPQEQVWLLRFEGSYPNVRVTQELASGELRYMAADQVVVELAPGVDVTALKPMLDQLGLRLRMFNRKERIAVVGVLHTGIAAVPDTLEAIAPWGELFVRAEPDWILFKGNGAE
ncbi:MAG: hypothetical protein ACLFU4_01555 [Opitutales bacterium]